SRAHHGAARGGRHRLRHPRGRPRAHLPAGLLHQGERYGHRPVDREPHRLRSLGHDPRAQQRAARDALPDRAAREDLSVGPRWLIVDDEESIRSALAAILRDEGYQPQLAPDGRAALRAVALDAPELVLLDIAMPGLGGIEVLHELRDHWPGVP